MPHAARHRDDVLSAEGLDELGVGARLTVLPLPDLALPLTLGGDSIALIIDLDMCWTKIPAKGQNVGT